MSFSENLRKIREEKGLTQREVAERLGVSVQNYSRYETGARNPRLSAKRKIAAALGVPLFELETHGRDTPDGTAVIWDEDGNAYIQEKRQNTPFDIFEKQFNELMNRKNVKDVIPGITNFLHEQIDFEDKKSYMPFVEAFFEFLPTQERKEIFDRLLSEVSFYQALNYKVMAQMLEKEAIAFKTKSENPQSDEALPPED